jgi:uncharacterized protein (DUF2147 family)
MRTYNVLLSLASLLMTAASAFAASGDEILGVWNNQEKDARIEIFRCADKYCGKILSLNEPDYPADSRDGIPGTPKLDHRNPDPALKARPIIGLQIVNDFVFVGDDLWKDGTVYDPKKGKTYSGRMTLVSPAQLNLRGFVGISLIGRTAVWTR